jgi:hypothetical protein
VDELHRHRSFTDHSAWVSQSGRTGREDAPVARDADDTSSVPMLRANASAAIAGSEKAAAATTRKAEATAINRTND